MSVIQIRWTAPDGVNYRGLFQDVLDMANFIQKHKIRRWSVVETNNIPPLQKSLDSITDM